MPGADGAMAEWAATAAADGRAGWLLDRASAEGYACDAVIEPVVTGQVDLAALVHFTTTYLDRLRRTKRWHPGATWPLPPPPAPGSPTGPLAPGPPMGALPPKTVRNGTAHTTPASEVFPDWQERLERRAPVPSDLPSQVK